MTRRSTRMALLAAMALCFTTGNPVPAADSARKPPELVAVPIEREFGEGWKQTFPFGASGETYDAWVQDGWLLVRRNDKDGQLDWQISLARVVGQESPQVTKIDGFQFELTYRDGRYTVRDTANFLRAVREAKTDGGRFERGPLLSKQAARRGSGTNFRKQVAKLSAWSSDDWFFVALGSDEDHLEALVRLDPETKRGDGYGVTTMMGGLMREFHGDTWLLDDGDLLVCQRRLKSQYEAELAREKIVKNIQGGVPPAIDAARWLNGDGASWDALKGKVVVLDFWGTWCGPCVKKIPKFQALSEKYAGQDLVVIGIHSAQEAENCAEFVAKNGITFPIAIDSGKTADSYAIDGWPTVFVIDKTGKVVSGYENDVPSEELLDGLLAQ